MSRTVILNNCMFTKEEYSNCLKYVSIERRNILSKFHRYIDQCRGLAASLLVRCIICNSLKIDNKDILFTKSEFGKPICLSTLNFEFNLSHSGNCVVGVFDDKQVGIDVEFIEDKNRDDIVNGFFNQQEKEYYRACIDKRSVFHELWTIKEAYIKYLGVGMSKGFNTFSVYWADGKIGINDYESKIDVLLYIECINIKNYYMTVIGETKTEFATWTLDDLLNNVSNLKEI